ncbi:MAG TPA: hypothetical protein DCG19_00565 [Cryomorphaceae bacterium]|nr:hypothetical protein [Owenweeksia sp.]MBF97754.1 hypothetical protein [Owenweeksia sp.]HAD95860.1 hypothetical protein [Cryomorphaceae bacterium]HBF19806.1 hypothetical protein [Cryomorphaceae bacterium]|tara:strand:+ start:8655 stop:9536 length:882 start_codon:yes stop_codon:yes gene_type:complete
MKRILIVLLSTTLFTVNAQTELDSLSFRNLVKISEAYSQNPNARGKDFENTINSLRTPALNPVADALIAIGKADEVLLSHRFLDRPNTEELKYWYVLREIHYNRVRDSLSRSPEEVAGEVLEQDIDERFLLDNYYYRIHSGIAMLFNKANLKKMDIDLDSYGLKNDTEKAILYFNICGALIQRFRVLNMMKNDKKLLAFAKKLPTFNGEPYYAYTDFDFEDFEFMGYDKTEWYKERHLGELYQSLMSHFGALANSGDKKEARELYALSIMAKPAYFRYSGMEEQLNKWYGQYK